MVKRMEKEPAKVGRPKEEIDYAMVARYAQAQCTQEMIAASLHLSISKCTKDAEFIRVYFEAKEEGKQLLLLAQQKSALNGNAQMQIWLGKQFLKQADKLETKNDDRITIVIAGDDKDV